MNRFTHKNVQCSPSIHSQLILRIPVLMETHVSMCILAKDDTGRRGSDMRACKLPLGMKNPTLIWNYMRGRGIVNLRKSKPQQPLRRQLNLSWKTLSLVDNFTPQLLIPILASEQRAPCQVFLELLCPITLHTMLATALASHQLSRRE